MRRIIQKLKACSLIGLVVIAVLAVPAALSRSVFAAPPSDASGSSKSKTNASSPGGCTGNNIDTASCKEVVKGGDCKNLSKCDLLETYINPLIKVLAALVGVVVVISIIIGGIQYSSSAGDPQAATAAKNRIRNAIIALVVFIFLYALLNFLIPGGLG